jgi:hypothetical protein
VTIAIGDVVGVLCVSIDHLGHISMLSCIICYVDLYGMTCCYYVIL